MPYLVVCDSSMPYRSFDSQAEADAAARQTSSDLPPELDGAEVRVLHALPPRRPGGRPRPDPDTPRPLARFVDGRRVPDD
jgi:hypothetical protein